MDPDDFKRRTRAFALRIIRLVRALPNSKVSEVIGRQLLRSGTSVGANYRSACRARSRADFVAKLKLVEEECDESLYWIELLIDSCEVKAELVDDLRKEGHALLALVVASIKTARRRKQPANANGQSSTVNRQPLIGERIVP